MKSEEEVEIQNQSRLTTSRNPVPTFQPEFFRVPPQMGMSLWEALGHLSEDLLCGCEAMCLLHTYLEGRQMVTTTWHYIYRKKSPEATLGKSNLKENQIYEQVS